MRVGPPGLPRFCAPRVLPFVFLLFFSILMFSLFLYFYLFRSLLLLLYARACACSFSCRRIRFISVRYAPPFYLPANKLVCIFSLAFFPCVLLFFPGILVRTVAVFLRFLVFTFSVFDVFHLVFSLRMRFPWVRFQLGYAWYNVRMYLVHT